jgi:hypothetical protein
MIDERTEILINRKLDGELTQDQSLELDKLVIRNPEVRQLLEEYTRLDRQASETLWMVVNSASKSAAALEFAYPSSGRQRWTLPLGFLSGLAAALVLAVALSHHTARIPGLPNGPHGETIAGLDGFGPPAARPRNEGNIDMVAALEGPRCETDSIDRDVIGLFDQQSQSLYVLEVDSARSLVEPVRANY